MDKFGSPQLHLLAKSLMAHSSLPKRSGRPSEQQTFSRSASEAKIKHRFSTRHRCGRRSEKTGNSTIDVVIGEKCPVAGRVSEPQERGSDGSQSALKLEAQKHVGAPPTIGAIHGGST